MKRYLKLRLKPLYCAIIIDIECITFSLTWITVGLRVKRNHELILPVSPPAL